VRIKNTAEKLLKEQLQWASVTLETIQDEAPTAQHWNYTHINNLNKGI